MSILDYSLELKIGTLKGLSFYLPTFKYIQMKIIFLYSHFYQQIKPFLFLNKLMSFIIVGTNTCNKSFLGNSRKFLYSINTTKICIFIPIRINMFCNLINPAACESENDETMLMYETFMNLKIMWSIKNRHYYL